MARACTGRASAVENDLVEAMAHRFQKPHPVSPEDYDRWDDDYAVQMRQLHQRYPDDADVAALFAEALITRTPRRLWDLRSGRPAANSDVLEALDVCEGFLARSETARAQPHPAIAHMHIHALEMSCKPERAMISAEALAGVWPDAGHINHMPAHIYVLCGDYARAREVSEHSVEADDRYAAYAGSNNFYVTARCHDLHLLMFACMFLGQFKPALAAAEKMQAILTENILRVRGRPKLATTTEGYYSTKMHVLVRFGRWREIIEQPTPGDPALYLLSTAMHHYARGIAFASLGDIPAAQKEQCFFLESLTRIPPDRRFLSNPAIATLAVGEKMLQGEIEYHSGNYDAAFEHLREAVRRDDALSYTEPWAWMHPPRHALGALLLAQGHVEEAERVYRDDLGLSDGVQRCTQHPNNVWSLHGLVECLQRRGASNDRLEAQLAAALIRSDIAIASSCMCRTIVPPTAHCCGC